SLGSYASLARRTTPLLLREGSVQSLDLKLKLPPGSKVENLPPPITPRFGEMQVGVQDSVEGDTLILRRSLQLAAGRIQPPEYPAFQAFARKADDALASSVRITRK